MERCKDCRFWRKHPFAAIGICMVPNTRMPEACSLTSVGYDDEGYFSMNETEIRTGPEFGCVLFEQKGGDE